ncbi:MAG: LysR family transcriptional regulator [Burkholderiaceae bacterium]|nr:LysR family transcriptional regulator [Burkholderiaceae bacterium]
MKLPSGNRVTLRQFEAFCAVAMAGGVSKAAKGLSRTQSAVSMSLIELENALGVKLFERVGRRLLPTDAGRRLLPRAVELVDRVDEFVEMARDEPTASGHVSIGASRTVGPFMMPELMERFLAENPGATLELVVANTEDLLQRVRALTLDCVFVEGDVNDPDLARHAWMTDTLCMFARAEHPLVRDAGQRPRAAVRVAQAELAGVRWALREPGSGTRELFLRALATIGTRPRIATEISDPFALKQMVMRSDFLGCLSRRAIADELGSGTLVEVRIPAPEIDRMLARILWAVWHPGRYRSPIVERFVAFATEAARER